MNLPPRTNNSPQERFIFISHVRVISMILIIAFHSLCYYTGIWWFLNVKAIPIWEVTSYPIVKIGLASFVCISGFLFGHLFIAKEKYRQPYDFFVKKTYRLITPYISGSIILIIMPDIHISWENMFTGTAHLWFLLVLFELFIFFYPLAYYNIITRTECKNAVICDICAFLISFFPVYAWKAATCHHHLFCIETTLCYIPVFLSGFYVAKYQIYNRISLKTAIIVFILTLIGLLTISFYRITTYIYIYRIPTILAAICLLVVFSKRKKYPLFLNNLVSSLDKHSMDIYFFNQIIIFSMLIPSSFRAYFDLHPYIGPLLLFITSLLIPWALSWAFQKTKYLSWITGNISFTAKN